MFWDNIFNAKRTSLILLDPQNFNIGYPPKITIPFKELLFLSNSSLFGYLFLKRPGCQLPPFPSAREIGGMTRTIQLLDHLCGGVLGCPLGKKG